MKLEQYQLEIQYVIKVFHAIYKKFLTAIDHVDYHPLQKGKIQPKLKEVKYIAYLDTIILKPKH